MLKLKKIAVTGGLAAGKSTVCQLFNDLGAYVVSADEIVHQLLVPGTVLGQKIIRLFGSDIISGHILDRKKIAAKVFSQPELLQALEELIHPAVFNEIDKKYQQAQKENTYSLFLAEIPLLYEAKKEQNFDLVICVLSSEDLCKKRFLSQSTPQDAFEKRMNRQIDPQKKAKNANYIIENNGNLEQLKIQVKALYNQLTKNI